MRSPQHKPTVEELVKNLGGMFDEKFPNMVGLIINNRVLWINVQSSLLVDADVSANMIARHKRKNGIVDQKEVTPTDSIKDMLGDVPEMTFLAKEVEEAPFELPSWLSHSTGLASDHEVDEGW